MKKKLLLLIFILFIPNISVFAETTQVSLQENQAYKMLYEDLKDTNGKILDTVYFTLTFAAGFILLFLGSNAWMASRSRKKEFETLKSENEAAILKMKNELRGEMKQHFQTLEQKMVNKNSEDIDQATRKVKSTMEKLESEITEIKGTVNELQGNIAYEKEDYSNALFHYVQYAKFNRLKGLGLGLDNALSLINETLTKMDSISTFHLGILTNFMMEIPDSHIVQQINKTLEKIKIY